MVDRASLPAEFFDLTDAHLLVKPEPQYIYNQLLMSALAADLPVPDTLGHIGREIGGVNADYSNDKGTLKLEDRQIPQSLFAVTTDMQGLPGHTVRFNRPLFTNSTYTIASRLIGTNDTISTTPINVGSEQTTMTLQRFAGPLSTATSRPAPYALDALDATLGVHNMAKIVGTHMKRDFHRFQDSVIGTLLNAGGALYPDVTYTSKDNFTTGSNPLDYTFVSYAERVMDDANLPTLPDGKRLLVVSPAGAESLKLDPMVQRLKAFHVDLAASMPATYLLSVGKFHIFESTTLSTLTSTGSGTPTVYRAQAIAPGALGAGMGKAPHVAYSNDDNYGQTAKVVWIAYMAYALLDSSFVYNLYHTAVTR